MKNVIAFFGACLVVGSVLAHLAGTTSVFELGIGVVIGVALACLVD
ncbi:MAG: hypothetical protein KAJ19_06520 [Gammaproteobacteria bacterium]|nr:hypothetical protein [Gammaproteobacteria bacterium]